MIDLSKTLQTLKHRDFPHPYGASFQEIPGIVPHPDYKLSRRTSNFVRLEMIFQRRVKRLQGKCPHQEKVLTGTGQGVDLVLEEVCLQCSKIIWKEGISPSLNPSDF